MRWMDLESIMQSEVSHKEKNKYCILTHIWNLERWYCWTYLWGSSGGADIKHRLMDTGGWGEGESAMNGESSMETYTTICKIDSQWEFAVWLGELKLGLGNNLEEVGWGGKWEGGSSGRGPMYIYGWFMLMFGRNQHSSVKQLSVN